MKAESVAVDLRLSTKADSKVTAFADVTIPLGDDGTITIKGCSLLHSDGRPPRVMLPARKGTKAWFDVVDLKGKVRIVVEEAVVAEYHRQTRNSKK